MGASEEAPTTTPTAAAAHHARDKSLRILNHHRRATLGRPEPAATSRPGDGARGTHPAPTPSHGALPGIFGRPAIEPGIAALGLSVVILPPPMHAIVFLFFFFTTRAPPDLHTLPLHNALPT